MTHKPQPLALLLLPVASRWANDSARLAPQGEPMSAAATEPTSATTLLILTPKPLAQGPQRLELCEIGRGCVFSVHRPCCSSSPFCLALTRTRPLSRVKWHRLLRSPPGRCRTSGTRSVFSLVDSADCPAGHNASFDRPWIGILPSEGTWRPSPADPLDLQSYEGISVISSPTPPLPLALAHGSVLVGPRALTVLHSCQVLQRAEPGAVAA